MKLGKIPGYLALTMLSGFLVVMLLIIFVNVEKESMELLKQMATVLGTVISMAAGYHFKKEEIDL